MKLFFVISLGLFTIANANAEQVWECFTVQAEGACSATCSHLDQIKTCAGTGSCNFDSNNGSVTCSGRIAPGPVLDKLKALSAQKLRKGSAKKR